MDTTFMQGLRDLSPSDRFEALSALCVAAGVAKGIEKTPGICGGDARIAGTRIPVWLLSNGRRLGYEEVDLLQSYPMLSAGDLMLARAYEVAYPDEVARSIEENDTEEGDG